MPTPYRKSCQPCVKAKRRCDLGSPCYRCRVRRLSCSYDTVARTKRAVQGSNNGAPSEASITQGSSGDPEPATFILPADTHEDQQPLPEYPDHNLDWNEVMSGIDDYIVPDQMIMPPPNAADLILNSRKYQERVVHSVKHMKTWPLAFASQAQAPFINMNLWPNELPDVIKDALGICSQYAHRNSRNGPIVFQCLSQAARECAGKLSTPIATIPLNQRLAVAQAMCLYQTIQLFDGDIRMRSEAEAALPLLTSYLRDLRKSSRPVHSETPLTTFDAEGTGSVEVWQDWLLHESIRRTLITGFSLDGLFTFLKQGWDDDSEFNQLSFTAQKTLWEAPSLFHWQQAAAKKNWLPVLFDTWTADIVSATPDDIEDLGMTMMTLMKGMDHCRRWVGEANLERFDLLPPG